MSRFRDMPTTKQDWIASSLFTFVAEDQNLLAMTNMDIGNSQVQAMLNTETADLKTFMAENPGAVVEDVARDRNVTPRAVLEAMPSGMVRIGGGEHFVAAMQDIAEWGEVTLIVHTPDGIFETTAPVSPGALGHGYYNLSQPKGLHGHLRHTRCGGVAFVTRSFRGNASAFVAFLNVDGGIMFKVFIGRDETRTLKADQMARFESLATTCQAT